VATIEVDPQWFNALAGYVQDLQATSVQAAESAVNFLHEQVINKARLMEGWSDLADNIEVWSQDGMLVIGLQDNALTSQAFALEYGDEVRPPNALFRDLSGEVRAAGQRMRQSLEEHYGYGKIT